MNRVCIFMSTYNGEKYIVEQLQSILSQRDVAVNIVVRDDGSSDKTYEILKKYEIQYDNIVVTKGANIGYANSFLTSMLTATNADYYAFSDQDDIWEEKKLIHAIRQIKDNPMTLYASSLLLVDENDNAIKLKGFPNFTPGIGSLLTRNRLAGCTMVFSKQVYSDFVRYIPAILRNEQIKFGHDAWLLAYLFLSNGSVLVDGDSLIHYRRHKDTVTYSGKSLLSRVKKEWKSFRNKDNRRIKISKFLLENCPNNPNEDAIEVLRDIATYKNSIDSRIRLLFTKKIRCGLIIVDLRSFIALSFGIY